MPAHIRPVTASDQDLDALYAICLATGVNGADAASLYRDPKLIGHIFSAPYAVLSPQTGFVAEDDAGVGGYVVGAYDTTAFEHRLEQDWWPSLRARYPDPSDTPFADWTADQLRSFMIHHPHRTNAAIVARYPAHVHMNLLPRLQRQGVGSQLLSAWLEAARASGVSAVHCGVNPANVGGLAFWSAAGFEPLGPDYSGSKRTVWMGRDI